MRCTESGLSVLKNAATVRQTFNDPKNRTALDNILSASRSKAFGSLELHKTCYSSFTSKYHQDRLQRSQTSIFSRPFLQNWELCMFCQSHADEKLHQVLTFQTYQEILDHSKYYQFLHVHLSPIHDLIVAEGEYHLRCYLKSKKQNTIFRFAMQ